MGQTCQPPKTCREYKGILHEHFIVKFSKEQIRDGWIDLYDWISIITMWTCLWVNVWWNKQVLIRISEVVLLVSPVLCGGVSLLLSALVLKTFYCFWTGGRRSKEKTGPLVSTAEIWTRLIRIWNRSMFFMIFHLMWQKLNDIRLSWWPDGPLVKSNFATQALQEYDDWCLSGYNTGSIFLYHRGFQPMVCGPWWPMQALQVFPGLVVSLSSQRHDGSVHSEEKPSDSGGS